MEDRADETRGQLSEVDTSKKRLYILSIFIFVFFVSCSLSLPPRFHSYVSRLFDSNDRHYIFLLCNGILLFLFLDSGSARTSQINDKAMTTVYINDQPEPTIIQEVEHNVVLVTSVAEEETKAELIDHGIQDLETDLTVVVDDEDEIVATVEVEDEIKVEVEVEVEDDEFNQKCQAFIDKIRRTMHHEAPYGLVTGGNIYID